MTKELRLFLLAIVLPALIVVAGGVRLLSVEADRLHDVARETLRLRTKAIADNLERSLSEKAAIALANDGDDTNADPDVLGVFSHGDKPGSRGSRREPPPPPRHQPS